MSNFLCPTCQVELRQPFSDCPFCEESLPAQMFAEWNPRRQAGHQLNAKVSLSSQKTFFPFLQDNLSRTRSNEANRASRRTVYLRESHRSPAHVGCGALPHGPTGDEVAEKDLAQYDTEVLGNAVDVLRAFEGKCPQCIDTALQNGAYSPFQQGMGLSAEDVEKRNAFARNSLKRFLSERHMTDGMEASSASSGCGCSGSSGKNGSASDMLAQYSHAVGYDGKL